MSKQNTQALTNQEIIWQIQIWFNTRVLNYTDSELFDLDNICFPENLNTLDLDKYYYDLNSYAAIDEYIKNYEVSPYISEGPLVGLAIFFYLHAKLGHNIVFYPNESFRKKNVFLVEEENTVYYIKHANDVDYSFIRNIVLDLSKRHSICKYKILTPDKAFRKTKMFRHFVFDLHDLFELNLKTKHIED